MNIMSESTVAEILLVEDCEGDIRLTREALRDSKIANNLHVVMDGVQALDFLHARGEYDGALRPDLIILDLNLPRKDGREVLEEIKSDDALRLIPVAVLTTSREDEDVVKSYASHANCYIRKPLNMDEFFKVVRIIENFWFQIVKLPPKR
ncbi:MAG: response regulator [Sphingomonadales bacterium]|nr:response regulator [Sphingomonadales bacterium]